MISFTISSTYPADLGVGHIYLDWSCIFVMWAATIFNGYLAVYRVLSLSGTRLLGLRMIAVGFLGQALNLSFRMWQASGDLLVSPPGEVFYMLIAIGSCLIRYGLWRADAHPELDSRLTLHTSPRR